MMNLQPIAYAWLALAFLIAVVVDFVVVRILLDFLRPTSAYVFWIGRAGKIAGLAAWVLYVNMFWYPQYLGAGAPMPQLISVAEWSCVGVLAFVALATQPRLGR
ncbi:MAG: hypothetical protein K0Q72_4373 [Armatimonadetes bacterium]|jgi:hypothetical protein|nr:hypothetical protein [Armatimonadota bacterium]